MDTPLDQYAVKAILALSLTIVCYYAYYFPAFSAKTARWFQKSFSSDQAKVYLFLFQQTLGFLLLGVVPALVFFSKHTLSVQKHHLWGISSVQWWHFALIILLIITSSFFSAKKHDVYSRLPKMRLSHWGPGQIAASVGGWVIYLLGYEFLFRGLLLFTSTAAFGLWPAIIINIGLYSAFHLPNGAKETLASIPFGFVLCLIALITGSFWPAFVLHLTLSASAEMFSVWFNPSTRFKLYKGKGVK